MLYDQLTVISPLRISPLVALFCFWCTFRDSEPAFAVRSDQGDCRRIANVAILHL